MGLLASLAKGLLIFGTASHVAAACTRSVQAKQGDTCLSLANAAGISMNDFMRSNPSVTSCSQLVAGATYCVEGVADGALRVSTDGSCGSGVTCAGSEFGQCCSQHGYCGSTSDHCGPGCQADFGTCGTSTGPITSSPVRVTTTITATATATTTITRTSAAVVTSTVVATRTTGVTGTVVQTSTVVRTNTVVATSTAVVTRTAGVVTLTTIVTSTSVALRTSTITSTAVRTSFALETLTTIQTITVTAYTTATATGTARPSVVTSVTVITPPAASPSPVLPGSARNCKSYDKITNTDTCRSIAQRNNATLLDFYKWNPSVSAELGLGSILLCTLERLLSGLCQIDCDNLWPGYYVCVKA